MNILKKIRLRYKYRKVRFYNLALTEVQENVEIGEGTRIGSFTLIQKNSRIGRNCTIGSFCNISSDVEIGDNVSIQTGCHITKGVRIGANSFIGPGVITMNSKYMQGNIHAPIIGEHTRIGGGSCLLPEIKIGSHVLVGSGSVVTKNIEDNKKVMGNPARTIESK